MRLHQFNTRSPAAKNATNWNPPFCVRMEQKALYLIWRLQDMKRILGFPWLQTNLTPNMPKKPNPPTSTQPRERGNYGYGINSEGKPITLDEYYEDQGNH
ncbi:hypothetical protein PROFUN_16696 [Planoprotostelium fungivorum]|uniref:Uncharacterized protein n=1 Tax=Planoprotostelium fungivorum TaxID=1890364 RepID=A0A2P6MPT8_9EUKA|nr:hypothetical protein PROFUN_16696 [Planoprotostelium fungivorum]